MNMCTVTCWAPATHSSLHQLHVVRWGSGVLGRRVPCWALQLGGSMGGDPGEENVSYVQSRLGATGREQTPQGELDTEPRVGLMGGVGKSSGRPGSGHLQALTFTSTQECAVS